MPLKPSKFLAAFNMLIPNAVHQRRLSCRLASAAVALAALLPAKTTQAQAEASPTQATAPVAAAVQATASVEAVGSPTPLPLSYPTSRAIAGIPLDPERRSLLTQVIYLSGRADFKAREETRQKLCGSVIHRPPPAQAGVKAALTVTEADMSVEVLFKKGTGSGIETPGEQFSFEVKMDDSRVLVRSSTPRFSTEAAGLSIPFPSDHTRPFWLEGKEGTNMLVLIPTLKECAVRSVVLCPRTYDGRSSLVQSKYAPVAARYSIKTKSDGLFSAPKGEPGRIVASIRGSTGVPVPEPWSKESVSGSTVTVTLKYITPEQPDRLFTPITLPSPATLESRLDFGTPSAAMREVWTRSSIEVSEIKLENWPSVRVRTADLKVESGPCYLVTQFGEMQL